MAAVFALFGLVLAAQDDVDWPSAKRGLDQAFTGETKPADRVQAVLDLGKATTAETEVKTVNALLQALDTEIARTPELKVSGEVLSAISTVLSAIRTNEAVDRLVRVAQAGGAWRKRAYAIKALASIPGSKVTQALIDLVYVGREGERENEPHVATTALDALAVRGDKQALETMHRAIADPNLPWEARLGALEGIMRIGDKSSIGKLVEALGSISDAQARLKVAVIESLQKMTGLDLKTADPQSWKEALKTGKAGPDDGGTRVRPTEFFGLKTESSRIVFVLDHSGSMVEPASDLGTQPPKAPEIEESIATGKGRVTPRDPIAPNEEIGPGGVQAYKEAKELYDKWLAHKVVTRLDLVKKEFIKSLFWLDRRVEFAVFFYSTDVTPLTQNMLPATWANKAMIMKAVEKVEADSWTNIGDPLFDYAMKLVAQPGRGGKYEGTPMIKTGGGGKEHMETIGGPDTIYLLTDGEPNAGRFSPVPDPANCRSNAHLTEIQQQTKQNISNELKKISDLRKVKLHTICVGDIGAQKEAMHKVDAEWLRSLSELTGGNFVHVTGK